MANYSELLNDINAAIYENNDQEIDALEVRAILREMVTSLGSGFLFKGIATPSSPSGTGTYEPDQNVFYLATTAGTYTYLGGLVVAAGEVAFLCFDGTWTKKSSALLSTGSIVDNTTTEDATKPLSAKQGKVLADAGAATAAEVTALGHKVDGINFTEIHSPNLFDKSAATTGKYVRKDLGSLESNASWAVTDYIDISNLTTTDTMKVIKSAGYSGVIGVAFYNSSKTFTHGGTASVAVQSGDAYYRASIPASELDTAMVVVNTNPGTYYPYGDSYKISVESEDIKDGAVTKDKFADDAVVSELTGVVSYPGFNRLDSSKYVHGYINKTTGVFVALASGTSDNLMATDFIPVSVNGLHIYCRGTYGAAGDGAVYDASKQYLRALTSDTYTFVEGDAFVRWTASTSYNMNVVAELNNGNTIEIRTPIPSYQAPQVFKVEDAGMTLQKSNVPDFKPALTLCGANSKTKTESTVSAETAVQLTGYPAYIKNDGIVSFCGKISTFAGVEVGLGKDVNNEGYFVRVTDSTVQLGKFINNSKSMLGSAVSHGLTVSGFIAVTVLYGGTKFNAIITSASGNYVAEFTPDQEEKSGVPYAYTMTGTALSDVVLSANCKHFKSPVWVIGDSYTTLSSARWPYQLKELGIKGFFLDGDSGADSARMYTELGKLLALGSPKFLVWAIGMNDYNLCHYAECLTNIERLCRTNGTELILTTIPWPTNGNKGEINTYIKQTGHRYIDFYSAVSSDANGTWYEGMNADGVHPTVLGAKALASRVLVDFPEIAMLD